MLERLKNIEIFKEKYYAVVGIVLGDPISYDVLLLNKEKNNLSISKSFTTTDFVEIKKEVSQKVPLILNFSGKGIINKMVGAKGNYLKEVLFNTKSEDFYIYTVLQGTHNFVSICRKEVVDYHIAQFKNAKYYPVDYSIGPFAVIVSNGIIKEDVLRLDNEELIFSNGNLTDYRRCSEELKTGNYKVGSDLLKGKEVLLLSSLLNNLYPSDKIEYDNGLLSEDMKEHKRKKALDFFAVGSFVAFLSVLLGSYLLLLYFNKEFVRYEKQLYHFNDNYAQIKKMEEELENKRFIVENSGVSNRKFLSFYINELAASTPDGILLSSLEINPLDKKIKTNKPISLRSNTVLVDGETNNSFFVNQWVKRIKDYPWVGKIEILSLNRIDKKTETFSLKIEIY